MQNFMGLPDRGFLFLMSFVFFSRMTSVSEEIKRDQADGSFTGMAQP